MQVLIGSYDDFVVTIFFDASGNFERYESRAYSKDSSEEQSLGHNSGHASLLDARRSEIDFVPADIQVSRFVLPDLPIGIYDVPLFLQEFLDNPSLVKSLEEGREWYIDVDRWHAQGKFVFRWGKEYWMSSQGDVTDT